MYSSTINNKYHQLRRLSSLTQAGFTLAEVLIVLAIAAILLAIGISNFRPFIDQSRFTSAANDMVTAINLARSEAVFRGRPVAVQQKGVSWAEGWTIFMDPERDGLRDLEPILREGVAVGDGLQINADTTTIIFEPCGRRSSDSGLPLVGFLVRREATDQNEQHWRRVCVERSGRISVIKGNNACS